METVFEAHRLVVLLNILVPILLGGLTGILLKTVERIYRGKRRRG